MREGTDIRCFDLVLNVEIEHTDAEPNPADWDWSELLGVTAANAVAVAEVKPEPSEREVDLLHNSAVEMVQDLMRFGLTVVRED